MRNLCLPAMLALVLLVATTGCRGPAEVIDPDTLYAHRYEPVDPEGREILEVAPPVPEGTYFLYPPVVHDVKIRRGPMDETGHRPVDIVLLGALHDACAALHHVRESRIGHIIDIAFEIMQPRRALCAQVVRPFRFYHELADPLPPGPYTLRINDDVHPFEVFPELPADR
jgi:hypothetical protein